ncbi:hypothetical protein NP233_g2227 [Leucocoprinus birnbaumii]|uniref:Uncharacterized protein n=1 Tax=Leucocoprinus birnbaumii TaxID=56174 RepID=A0AAD5VYN1_9AGAR|nr:hypothetical protein NP233_g2227 [Leucocoprinus birnbaumii]
MPYISVFFAPTKSLPASKTFSLAIYVHGKSYTMFASRIVRQMATGANKDPSRIKKENQRVILGVAGLIGLTGLAYYAGFAAEGKRPKGYNERKN